MTVTEKIAKSFLEEGTDIKIGNKPYHIPPPTIRTLIKVSGLSSKIPEISADSNSIMDETLRVAKDCEVLGDILATFILGGAYKPKWYNNKYKKLRDKILDETTPLEYASSLATCLKEGELGHFFQIITILSGVNIIKPTKKTDQTRPTQ